MIEEDIKNWIGRISEIKSELGGYSVCPFAKGSEYEIINTDGSDINPPPWDFELIIYVFPSHYQQEELVAISAEYNKMFSDLIFLPDHKDRDTFIKGVQTNNGKHNLILCQWRDNLTKARNKLTKTDYYTHWDQDYLKEIINT
jgi:hypothetical protein